MPQIHKVHNTSLPSIDISDMWHIARVQTLRYMMAAWRYEQLADSISVAQWRQWCPCKSSYVWLNWPTQRFQVLRLITSVLYLHVQSYTPFNPKQASEHVFKIIIPNCTIQTVSKLFIVSNNANKFNLYFHHRECILAFPRFCEKYLTVQTIAVHLN